MTTLLSTRPGAEREPLGGLYTSPLAPLPPRGHRRPPLVLAYRVLGPRPDARRVEGALELRDLGLEVHELVLERGVLRLDVVRAERVPRREQERAREVVERVVVDLASVAAADDEDVAHRALDVAGPDRGLDQVDARRAQRRGQRGQEPREVRPFDDERRRVARRRVVGLDLERVAVGRAGLGEVPRLEVRALPRIDEEQVEEAQRAARDDARERAEEADAPRRRLRALRGRELRGPEPQPLREAVERAAEHDAGRVAADLAARLRSVRGEIRVGVLFKTLEERTAADSVDRPNVTPSVQSIKLPAWIMIVLSMRPKPTMGTAQTRKWRESSRRGAAADDACREAAIGAGEALPRVRSRRTRAAARPRRQAARRRISEQWQRNTSCDLTRSAVPTYGTYGTVRRYLGTYGT